MCRLAIAGSAQLVQVGSRCAGSAGSRAERKASMTLESLLLTKIRFKGEILMNVGK